ncbi:hypothetical protein Hanom_Chr02g00112041 [Helianthus anomalus]
MQLDRSAKSSSRQGGLGLPISVYRSIDWGRSCCRCIVSRGSTSSSLSSGYKS